MLMIYPPAYNVSSLQRGMNESSITPHSIVYTVGISFRNKYIYLVFGPLEFVGVKRKLLMENTCSCLELQSVIKDTSFCISLHGLNPHS